MVKQFAEFCQVVANRLLLDQRPVSKRITNSLWYVRAVLNEKYFLGRVNAASNNC